MNNNGENLNFQAGSNAMVPGTVLYFDMTPEIRGINKDIHQRYIKLAPDRRTYYCQHMCYN